MRKTENQVTVGIKIGSTEFQDVRTRDLFEIYLGNLADWWITSIRYTNTRVDSQFSRVQKECSQYRLKFLISLIFFFFLRTETGELIENKKKK